MQEATPALLAEWKQTWLAYKDTLRPNRKTGAALIAYLRDTYPLLELHDPKATAVVVRTVLENEHWAEKLPVGTMPQAVTFVVENTGAGAKLYAAQDTIFKGIQIFVGIDLQSGFFCVEGSSLLWDVLCAQAGLDERDLQNFYCVAMYVACCKRFGLL